MDQLALDEIVAIGSRRPRKQRRQATIGRDVWWLLMLGGWLVMAVGWCWYGMAFDEEQREWRPFHDTTGTGFVLGGIPTILANTSPDSGRCSRRDSTAAARSRARSARPSSASRSRRQSASRSPNGSGRATSSS